MVRTDVTVLMANYNGGEFLRHSVKSVLDQSYKDFEFLIIDDCSTDQSVDIIESFGDSRIRVHRNSANQGQTKSLNIGLKMASADLIARMDADDIAFSNWLEKQVENFRKQPDHSVISTYVTAIDASDLVKKIYKPSSEISDLILRSLIASPINHVGSIFKKKDILDCGGYDERYKTAADFDLWGKLLRSGKKITTTKHFLVAIREHESSLSSRERGKRELEEIIDIAGKNIKAFTNVMPTDHEVQLFCKANYNEESISDEEFIKAVEITKRVYAGLDLTLDLSEEKKQRWQKERCKTIYLKRVFSYINRKQYGGARRLSYQAIKEFGPTNIFMAFWAASLLGGLVLGVVPKLYFNLLRRKACSQLKAQPGIETLR